MQDITDRVAAVPARKRSGAGRPALGTHDGKAFTFSPLERTPEDVGKAIHGRWDTGELVYEDERRRMLRWEMQVASRELLKHPRLVQCYRIATDEVRVWRRPTSATYYRGLRVCGLVWACPVCAAKIAERRRVELVTAIEAHREQGGSVLMLTLTVPHTREDTAFSLTGRLLKAFTAFGQGKRAWTTLLPGVVGTVRALEVTHGQANGWHPHIHVLVFLEGRVRPADYSAVLLDQWAKVTKRHNLAAVNTHGLRLDGADQAGKYASKWGLEDEMTKAHIKQGRKGGNRTPWALLADHTAGDAHAGYLFREFFQAFKGKHQLRWSRGLRARFGLGQEKTDEEVAAEQVDTADVLAARFTPEDWKLIRRHELRGLVLELLRGATFEAVDMLLNHYRGARGAASTVTPSLSSNDVGASESAVERGMSGAGSDQKVFMIGAALGTSGQGDLPAECPRRAERRAVETTSGELGGATGPRPGGREGGTGRRTETFQLRGPTKPTHERQPSAECWNVEYGGPRPELEPVRPPARRTGRRGQVVVTKKSVRPESARHTSAAGSEPHKPKAAPIMDAFWGGPDTPARPERNAVSRNPLNVPEGPSPDGRPRARLHTSEILDLVGRS